LPSASIPALPDSLASFWQAQESGAEVSVPNLLKNLDDQPWDIRIQFERTLAATTEKVLKTLDRRALEVGTATLLAARSSAANQWLVALRDRLPTPLVHDPSAATLLFLGQMRGLPAAEGALPFAFNPPSEALESQETAAKMPTLGILFKNFSELLDKSAQFIDNPAVSYEKKKGLTQAYRYVMPVHVLRDHLSEGAKNRQLGRVYLASLLLLQSPDIEPDVVFQVVQSLIEVGGNEEARQIATYVFLGVTL
jgi:hypothetical protein